MTCKYCQHFQGLNGLCVNPWFNKDFRNRITNYFEKQTKHSLNILYLYVICYLREKEFDRT